MKLFSQLEHVDNATPLARRLDGNISEGIALCNYELAWHDRFPLNL